MTSRYINDGNTVDYANGVTARASGDVIVVGDEIWVAADAIAASTTGPCYRKGRHTLPKVTGAVIAQGERVMWDVSAGNVDDDAATAATGDIDPCGVALEAAGSGVLTIDVAINETPPGVT